MCSSESWAFNVECPARQGGEDGESRGKTGRAPEGKNEKSGGLHQALNAVGVAAPHAGASWRQHHVQIIAKWPVLAHRKLTLSPHIPTTLPQSASRIRRSFHFANDR